MSDTQAAGLQTGIWAASPLSSSASASASVSVLSTASFTASSTSAASSSASASPTASPLNGIADAFDSDSRYFGLAIAVTAIVSFLITLVIIALVQCCVRRRMHGNKGAALPDSDEAWSAKSRRSSTEIEYKEKASYASPTIQSSYPRRASATTINGLLAAPPRYERVALQEDLTPTVRQVTPSAQPPYMDASTAFMSPRAAPIPPNPSSPSRPSPLRHSYGPAVSSEAVAGAGWYGRRQ